MLRLQRLPFLFLSLVFLGVLGTSFLYADRSVDTILASTRFSPSEQESIRRLFALAADSGVSEEMLRPRLEEAIAKRVPVPRLVSALGRDVEFLRSARSILLKVESGEVLLLDNASWQRAAHLLAWGAAPEDLSRLARAGTPSPELFTAITNLYALLIQWGLDSEASLDLCDALAGSRIDIDSYPGVLDILVRGRRLQVSPGTLSRRMIETLPRVRDLKQLEQRTLYE